MSTRLRVRCQRERHRSLMVTCCLVRLARKNRVPPRQRIARKPSGENLPTRSAPEGADRVYRVATSDWGNQAVAIRHSRGGLGQRPCEEVWKARKVEWECDESNFR